MYRIIKRAMDIALGFIGAIFLIPIFIFIAPVIHFTDGGPVFFCGERLGYRCKVFRMYKFRSMRVNAPDLRNSDGSTYNSERDPRVTGIGHFIRKTSIDELPQLINVLKGDMSIVGPRPGTTDAEITSDEEKRRSVRPGITGYSQAYMRNSDTMEERMRNDCYYADHMSLAFDCRILLKTVFSVVERENVYRN